MRFLDKPKRDIEFVIENCITNLETGEKMEGRFFPYEFTPHNIPESWKRVKINVKDSMFARVV